MPLFSKIKTKKSVRMPEGLSASLTITEILATETSPVSLLILLFVRFTKEFLIESETPFNTLILDR